MTNPTRVVNIRGTPHDPDIVYIGRGSDWGNPFSRFVTRLVPLENVRPDPIAAYREYLWARIQAEGAPLIYALESLYGRTLGCYCAPKPCHGDVLAGAAEWAYGYIHWLEGEESSRGW